MEIKQEVWKNMRPKLTPEFLAGLSALFYFARDLDFSEQYVRLYEFTLQESVASFTQADDAVKSDFFHILGKTNGIYNILRSLYFLKKKEIAEVLVSAHGLDQKFSWLDDARSGALFKRPKHCGYTT